MGINRVENPSGQIGPSAARSVRPHHVSQPLGQLAIWLDRGVKYENVDKDPDLRKAGDLGPINRPWAPWALAVVGAFIGILLVVLAGWAGLELFDRFAGEESDAAAAGAWASAAGATALALASVWLAWRAEARAKEDVKRAEERHEKELAAAEKRLTDELDAQRRHQQVMCISPMWEAIVPYSNAYENVLDAARDAGYLRYQAQHAGRAVSMDDLAHLFIALEKWKAAAYDFEMSCNNALMLVTEPVTAGLISELYRNTRLLLKQGGDFANEALMAEVGDLDPAPLKQAMAEIRLLRRKIIRSARENIVGAEWLDLSIDGEDPFDVEKPTPAPTAGQT